MKQLAMDSVATPAEHRSYPKLTAEQKRSINEVWNDVCVPVLEEVDVMKQQVLEARLEAQDMRDSYRWLKREYDRLRWATRADA